jgi:hypothetical protein
MMFLVEGGASVDAVTLALVGLVTASLTGLFKILQSNKSERDAERLERGEERQVRILEARAREAETAAILAHKNAVVELTALIRDRMISG